MLLFDDDYEGMIECPNCSLLCYEEDLEKNEDGFCNYCQRWYTCPHTSLNPCYYFEDPCHYKCEECQNGDNFAEYHVEKKRYIVNRLKEIKKEEKELLAYLNGINFLKLCGLGDKKLQS